MKPLTIYQSTTVAVMADNIDTDIIIPKQYLKSIFKTGFGEFAFDPWRYHLDRSLNMDFPINKPQHKNAGILITGENFGCGSSREHAAWALQDLGFRVIIAGSYSDIFYNNWLNNGNLPIILPKDQRQILSQLPANQEITVNLEQKQIITQSQIYPFEISEDWRQRLLKGQDSISLTLLHEKAIAAYEKQNG